MITFPLYKGQTKSRITIGEKLNWPQQLEGRPHYWRLRSGDFCVFIIEDFNCELI